MKNFFLKTFFLILAILVIFIIFLSTKGLETDNFNNQIKNVIYNSNNSLNVELKKIQLKLNPINFNINAKTVIKE